MYRKELYSCSCDKNMNVVIYTIMLCGNRNIHISNVYGFFFLALFTLEKPRKDLFLKVTAHYKHLFE